MKKLTVLYSVALAAAFAVGLPCLHGVLMYFFTPEVAVRICVSAGVAVYACLLCSRRVRTTGCTFTIASVFMLQTFLLLSSASFSAFVFASCGLVWFSRAMFLTYRLSEAAMEALLVLTAFFAATSAATVTNMPALAIWSGLLVLALGTLIPSHLPGRTQKPSSGDVGSTFERAYRDAERAIASLCASS